MRRASSLLLRALLDPAEVVGMSPIEWDLLVRQARRSNLLARLHRAVQDADLLAGVPAAPRQHLMAADIIAQRQAMSVRWEVQCIAQALATVGQPVVLLKGAAYTLAGLPAALGRLYSDVDILVPRSAIGQAESALLLHGWQAAGLDDYDQHYYRRWMHEIPPLTHARRGTTIDVHHSILPAAAAPRFDAQALLDAAVPVAGQLNLRVLQPVDMVLHSATHLFHEGEFGNGLRDLFDLDSLLRHHGVHGGFWDELVARGHELGLTRSLWHALHATAGMLSTPVPPDALRAVASGRPRGIAARVLPRAYALALRPVHASVDTGAVRLARAALYLRAHWLRLPPHRLAIHLARKSFLRLTEKSTTDDLVRAPERER